MNIDNGTIRWLKEGESTDLNEVPVNITDMTTKQRKEMRVSLNDRTSILGLSLTGSRKERRENLRLEARAAKRVAKLEKKAKHD